MSYLDKATAERPADPSPEPWDTARHGAPDPSWPAEDQLRWFSRYAHVLLLSAGEGLRRRAAAQADAEVARSRVICAGR